MLSLTVTATAMTRDGLAEKLMDVARRVAQGSDFAQDEYPDGTVAYFDVKRHGALAVVKKVESDGPDDGPEVA